LISILVTQNQKRRLLFQLITSPYVFEHLKQYHCYTNCRFHTLVLPTLGSGAYGGVYIFLKALASVRNKINSIFYSSAPFANIFTAFAWKKNRQRCLNFLKKAPKHP
jgi:hypothetical protein